MTKELLQCYIFHLKGDITVILKRKLRAIISEATQGGPAEVRTTRAPGLGVHSTGPGLSWMPQASLAETAEALLPPSPDHLQPVGHAC